MCAFFFFFFNDTATTEIYTLSLHDALPIWVRVEAASPGVLLVVEDCGPGIPPELRERIFEPFHQGPNAQANRPGVGIGLSLVSSFAEIHGGRAWIEDRPGGGS